jgi:PHD/YefM family antitoxin component YafN of YafNO toxin-antitoxin module
MKSFTLSELVRRPSDVTHEAARGPVALTAHRKTRFVLLAVEDYQRLVIAGDTRQSFALADAPDEHLAALMAGAEQILTLRPDGEAQRSPAPASTAPRSDAD